jgi:1-aminocyclopropane-1-carboxylate deaminase
VQTVLSSPEMLFDNSKLDIEELHDDLFVEKEVKVSVLRLDKIHPVVSGNKLFKLHYFLEEALASPKRTIVTFGGAYSNHLAATAYACKQAGITCTGIVRGELPSLLSPTLQQCRIDGMLLRFISRDEYDNKDDPAFLKRLQQEFGNCIIIPEGGFHPAGAKGAALIYELIKAEAFTDICLATGTATTLAGLLMEAGPEQNLVAIPVLKGIADTAERLSWITGISSFPNLRIFYEYHFGGYAKRTDGLIAFMNDCWLKYRLPLDFVYTAKMLFAVFDLIKKNEFKKGSNIICLHTGGLQGNKSLPLNLLLF